MLKINDIHEDFDRFFSTSVKVFVGIFQTYGHNLARQRNILLRVNFEDLSILLEEVLK